MPDIGGVASSTAVGAAAGSVVPGIGTAIGAGIGFLGSLFGGLFAASSAQKAAEGRASIMRAQASEGISEAGIGIQRKGMQYQQFLGHATAVGGASGFQKTGSLDTYLTQLSTTLSSNLSWDALRAEKTATLQRQGAQVTEDTGQAQAVSDIVGGVTGAVGAINQGAAAGKWWGP